MGTMGGMGPHGIKGPAHGAHRPKGPMGPMSGFKTRIPLIARNSINVIWNSMWFFLFITSAILGTKLVRSLPVAVRNLSKFIRNTIPR